MDMQALISLGIGIFGLGAFLGIFFGISKLAGTEGNTGNHYVETAESVLDGIKDINNTLGKVLLPSGTQNMIDKIIQTTQLGVQKAEQLYKSGQLPPDLRKEEALAFSKDLLTLNGFDVTPALEQAIGGVAEALVYALPKS